MIVIAKYWCQANRPISKLRKIAYHRIWSIWDGNFE